MLEIENERQFVDAVHSALQNFDSPKCFYKRLNLATKGYEDVWRVWWSGKLPPKLEVDLVLTFKDTHHEFDDALLVGVEVKYFRLDARGRITPNFYEGLQQVLAYTLFGFDGVSLWHVFHRTLSKETVHSYSQAMSRMINEFGLPVFYLATRLIPLQDQISLECFMPSEYLKPQDLYYFVRWMKHYFTDETRRNPMRQDTEVQRRRSALKTTLQIPV